MLLLAYYLLIADGAATTSEPVVDWITRAGPVGVLALVLVLFLRGDIVPKSTLIEAQRQRDEAIRLVYDQFRIAHRAVDTSLQRLELEEKLAELREKEV